MVLDRGDRDCRGGDLVLVLLRRGAGGLLERGARCVAPAGFTADAAEPWRVHRGDAVSRRLLGAGVGGGARGGHGALDLIRPAPVGDSAGKGSLRKEGSSI